MKKTICFFSCILLFLPSLVFASSVPEANKKINVQVYVPSLFVGYFSGDVNFKITDRITLGPRGGVFSYANRTGYNLGLNMNYALSGDVFGDRVWLVNPYVAYSYDNLKLRSDKKVGAKAGVSLVHQWMWDGGVNTRAGIGVEYASNRPLFAISDYNFAAMLQFSIGLAF